ncbi:MAG TPA: peptidase T [Oscillospiraceae bacterium]|nr:peptidase T [Oscillospiraceae bacterium]
MTATERFLDYVTFDTQSDPMSKTHPSSEKQKKLGAHIADEWREIGLSDVFQDEYGCVYGALPATEGMEGAKVTGLIAHMDTSPDMPGENVKAHVVRYGGGDIVLNEEKGVVMRAAEFSHLERYRGQELIVTDGTTLLGADDKAGAAEITAALARIAGNPSLRHARIPVCLTTDEEIGQGADFFDQKRFAADWAYTVDGGALGEIEYENFNAASARVTVHGVNIHPGEAKNKMKNAARLAVELVNLLPPAETPEHTEGYEGFYHLSEMIGSEEKAVLGFIIRDHDLEKFEARKKVMERAVAYLNDKYGAGSFTLEMRDTYYNMREKILPHMHLIARAKEAMRKAGVEPICVPIRGGTDGARLSWEGLPCPNLSTGGHNFHGRFEYIPVQSLERMTDVLVHLVSEG